MAQYFKIHPENPQIHLLRQAVAILREGGIIVYPTDSSYALACVIGNKQGMDRIRAIRNLGKEHNFTLMCRDLSDISTYAKVDNVTFRLLKAFTPGPYTFLLKATKEVPRRLQHPKRRTIGLRIPQNPIALGLLETSEEPLMSTSLILPGADLPLIEPESIRELLGRQVDLIIDGGYCGIEQTTVIDLTGDTAKVVRVGKGEVTSFLEVATGR